MRRFALVLSACLAVAATAVAGFSFAGVMGPTAKGATAATTIRVEAYEYRFDLFDANGTKLDSMNPSIPAGQVTFHVVNMGNDDHDFAIAGAKTPTLFRGQSADITVTLNPGNPYPFACTIGEHAEFGMRGNVTVTGTTQTTTSVITTGGSTITSVITSTQPTTALPPPSQTVRVSEKEFKIIMPTVPKRVTYFVKVKGKRVKKTKIVRVQKPAKAVRTRFIVKNVGKIGHNFVIGGLQTPILKSGQSATIIVTLKKGKMGYLCSVAGHPALGMKGKLVVT
jgi:uncharacterized cupredoxin-like copper-binding protein